MSSSARTRLALVAVAGLPALPLTLVDRRPIRTPIAIADRIPRGS